MKYWFKKRVSGNSGAFGTAESTVADYFEINVHLQERIEHLQAEISEQCEKRAQKEAQLRYDNRYIGSAKCIYWRNYEIVNRKYYNENH